MLYENIQHDTTRDEVAESYQELGSRPIKAPSIYTSINQGVDKGDLNYENISSTHAARTQTGEGSAYEDVK